LYKNYINTKFPVFLNITIDIRSEKVIRVVQDEFHWIKVSSLNFRTDNHPVIYPRASLIRL